MLQKHLLIVEDDQRWLEFLLDAPHYSIGKDPKCDIQLISPFVSRRHAILIQLENDDASFSYQIVADNVKGRLSNPGLLINGHNHLEFNLQHEDEIVFGPKVRAIYYVLERDQLDSDFDQEPDSPDSDSGCSRQPYPFSPEFGAEALPDLEVSQIP